METTNKSITKKQKIREIMKAHSDRLLLNPEMFVHSITNNIVTYSVLSPYPKVYRDTVYDFYARYIQR